MNFQEEINAGQEFLKSCEWAHTWQLIGSALYLPTAKDIDFAVMVKQNTSLLTEAPYNGLSVWRQLERHNFRPCSNEYGDVDRENRTEWAAFRRGLLNLMVTNDETFYRNYLKAMDVCRFLELPHKWQRVGVCQIIRDDVFPNAEMLKAVYGAPAPLPPVTDPLFRV